MKVCCNDGSGLKLVEFTKENDSSKVVHCSSDEWITPKQAAEEMRLEETKKVSIKIKIAFDTMKFDEMNDAIVEKMTLTLIDRAKRNKRHLSHFRQKVKISKSHSDKTLRFCGVLYGIKTASELLQRWELKTKDIKK